MSKGPSRRAYNQRKLALIMEAKATPCVDCGIQYPHYVMDLDHRDPSTKPFNLSDGYSAFGYATILEEIAKCDVVCSNCNSARAYPKGHHSLGAQGV